MLTAHGLVSTVHHWMFFNPHYAGERQIVSWDYRGHGGQEAPRDREVSVAQFADDAHAVWRASRLAPTIVVGLSFGVQVALEIWRRHPDMVRALVLICGTPGHPLDRVSASPLLRRAAIGLFRGLGRQRMLARPVLALMRTKLGVRLQRELAYATGGAHREDCPAEVLEGLFGHAARLDPELIGNLIGAYLDHTAEDVLPTITVPTLIVSGGSRSADARRDGGAHAARDLRQRAGGVPWPHPPGPGRATAGGARRDRRVPPRARAVSRR